MMAATNKVSFASAKELAAGLLAIPPEKKVRPRIKKEVTVEAGPFRGTVEDMLVNMDKYAGKMLKIVDFPKNANDPYTGPMQAIKGEFTVRVAKKYGFGRYKDTKAALVEGVNFTSGMQVYTYLPFDTVVEEVFVPPEKRKVHETMVKLRENKYHHHIGADPEVFAEDEKGVVIPAFEFLGTQQKNAPRDPFWDGYQAEFGTSPMGCMAYHTDEIQRGLAKTLEAVRKVNKKAKLSVKTTMNIPPERLLKDDQKYVNFGCTPSLSAYDEKFPEVDPRSIPFRSAGGHLHFSLGPDTKPHVATVVKELDRVLGVIAVSLFQYYDDPRRRLMYGRAGEYRTPSYGLEYRTLSNAWMVHPMTTHFVYEVARMVIGIVGKEGGKPWAEWDATEEEVRRCINDCDVELAHTILDRNSLGLAALLAALPIYDQDKAPREGLDEFLTKVIYGGVDKVLTKPDEFSRVWQLSGGAAGYDSRWYNHSDGECGNILHTWRFVRSGKRDKID